MQIKPVQYLVVLAGLFILFINGCAIQDSSHDVQWENEVKILQSVVEERYNDIVFERLFAHPQDREDLAGEYRILATFITFDGHYITANYETNNISNTLDLIDTGFQRNALDEIYMREEEEQQRTLKALDKAIIAPQEAIAIAKENSLDFYNEHKSDIFIEGVLSAERHRIEEFDAQAVWLVNFSLGSSKLRVIWIDALTGKVLKVEQPF